MSGASETLFAAVPACASSSISLEGDGDVSTFRDAGKCSGAIDTPTRQHTRVLVDGRAHSVGAISNQAH